MPSESGRASRRWSGSVIVLLGIAFLTVGYPLAAGTCTGAASCSACSSCARCKHCRAGGTCGACAPAGKAPPQPSRFVDPAPRPTQKAESTGDRCAATTKKGTRCLRRAQRGRPYCYQH